ncbi:YfeK family protein [Ferrimonas marina]|uniref:DUF5329 domain-containing protein n=1 Tax=Ferrimonas marina TaxID=299255 RepID=A0A1M5NSV0_9GAMM|nr:DUF5329 domain-containing protein [Ferrimonas marina]SHG92636.1 hypothetical protein SAMN02745129_1168 [Ferrimonas marina]
MAKPQQAHPAPMPSLRGALACLALLGLLASPALARADVSADTSTDANKQEIQQLLEYVERSPCQFIRNGKAYKGEKARSHLERKYNYIQGKGHELTAEQFIEHAGTESSFTGRDYQIQCPDQDKEPSADWLLRELARIRQGQ